jgi:wyosine [tRNA(Phe)-imidazoG37] synthetase (radical SAM superfamily)
MCELQKPACDKISKVFYKQRVVDSTGWSYISCVVEATISKSEVIMQPLKKKQPLVFHAPPRESVFNRPKDTLGNRFVYAVISSRAGGLSLGVNMNPDRRCNFNCAYCEVDHDGAPAEKRLVVDVMAAELRRALHEVETGQLRLRPNYQQLPPELLKLRHVALSGDGEPTLAVNFNEALEAVVRVRALGGFFKIVLITNGTGLDQPEVQKGLGFLTRSDEIWTKLDGGTQEFLNRVNHPDVKLEKILANILLTGRQRPVIVQSLFAAIQGEEPPLEEIRQYAQRLKELKDGGARISLVQIYSAARPGAKSEWGHLPLRVLSRIAQTVRQHTGLRTEVF